MKKYKSTWYDNSNNFYQLNETKTYNDPKLFYEIYTICNDSYPIEYVEKYNFVYNFTKN